MVNVRTILLAIVCGISCGVYFGAKKGWWLLGAPGFMLTMYLIASLDDIMSYGCS